MHFVKAFKSIFMINTKVYSLKISVLINSMGTSDSLLQAVSKNY